jgi:hypothetical protein
MRLRSRGANPLHSCHNVTDMKPIVDTPIRRRLKLHWTVGALLSQTGELIQSQLREWQVANNSDTVYGMTIRGSYLSLSSPSIQAKPIRPLSPSGLDAES